MDAPRLRRAVLILGLGLSPGVAGCGAEPAGAPVLVSGSSTVYPIAEAAASEFRKRFPAQVLTITSSSTGTGLASFCSGELDVADASRPITTTEVAACEGAGVSFIEVPIAYDAICVVVNRANTWARSMTVAELKRLWEPAADGRITKWSQIREDWPDREIHLVGPDAESGTFDYFTEVINGATKSSRRDYTGHVDDHKIIEAVETDEAALGYVGFTHYERQEEKLHAVAIDDLDQQIGPGAIEPTLTNVGRGVYRPLSRPLFLYVRVSSLERPEVREFVEYFARAAVEIVQKAGGVPLTAREYELSTARLLKRVTGTMFASPGEGEVSLQLRLSRHQ